MKTQNTVFNDIQKHLESLEFSVEYRNTGNIETVGDGIVQISGLSEAMMGEIVEFKDGTTGMVINLSERNVGAIVLGNYLNLSEGDEVNTTGNIISVRASYNLLGRVVNPLMQPLDGSGRVEKSRSDKDMPIEKIAPGIIKRQSVNTPLQTGIKAIDSMIPVGRGQRELIIGDRSTGKSAVAIDTIINQAKLNREKKAKKVISIYVAIGQKQSKIVQVVDKLNEHGAMEDTIIVCANSSDSVALQYLAPYAGCCLGEYFMEKGEDVLIVYDDLTKHAWAYRQISLTLRRPSGREAYPGDIFYLHSRLLERACRLSDKEGGGSLTALPIIETQAQDISAYIPTNVISITDGQIYLEPDLFYQGIRPAVNIGLSVSRVGGAAQIKAMKQVAGKLRLDLAQYNELSAFAQFGSDMDDISKSKIERGKRLIEILKQPQFSPVDLSSQIIQIWSVTHGYLDDVEVADCPAKTIEFVDVVKTKVEKLSDILKSKEGINEEFEKKLIGLAEKYFKKN